MNDSNKIRDFLNELGVPYGIVGRVYLEDAIILAQDKPVCQTTKYIYPKIAEKRNTTPSRVERAIRHAIELTFSRGNLNALHRYFKNSINPIKGKMENRAFIDACAAALK